MGWSWKPYWWSLMVSKIDGGLKKKNQWWPEKLLVAMKIIGLAIETILVVMEEIIDGQ